MSFSLIYILDMRYIFLFVCFAVYSVSAQQHIDWTTHPNFDEQTRVAFGSDQDCSVIALAIACDIPYHRSFWLHRDVLGRPCATCPQPVEPFYQNIGAVLNELHLVGNVIIRPNDTTKITVRQLALLMQEQYVYVAVQGHALAIVNGLVFDNAFEPALDMEVRSAFTITRDAPGTRYD